MKLVPSLREFTTARVALGAAGVSLPTREVLDFQMAHAAARDAVHAELDIAALTLQGAHLRSAAPDRATYLRRPDLGRRLSPDSLQTIRTLRGEFDVVFVIADGLSALAVERHAAPVLRLVLAQMRLRVAPLILARQARVAIADEIGFEIGAAFSVILIGERPGLSSPDSLGIYTTRDPRPGRTDAERNCISNIHANGLSYEAAAAQLLKLVTAEPAQPIPPVRPPLPPRPQ
jgi:ethanolamine ammonia-lyase small subunit